MSVYAFNGIEPDNVSDPINNYYRYGGLDVSREEYQQQAALRELSRLGQEYDAAPNQTEKD